LIHGDCEEVKVSKLNGKIVSKHPFTARNTIIVFDPSDYMLNFDFLIYRFVTARCNLKFK